MQQSNNLRRMLLGTTGMALVLGSGAAFAQDQSVLETVIVTATKQATDIQKTSLSITAVLPDAVSVAGQARLTDILQNVAGLQVFKGAVNNGAYFVRGIGTAFGANSTPELVDGVSVNWYSAEAVSTADSTRVEVLRGPQGTLYGRGAFAGVINIVTNDPSDKYEGKVFIEGGSYNEVKSQAIVNIPLSDDMAMRIVAFSQQQTGYMHPDGRANTDVQGFRAKFQYKPNEDFRLQLVGSFVNSVQTGSADALPQTIRVANWTSPAFGGFNPCGGDPHPNKYDPWHSPPKYYSALSCTVPAQLPVNPNPVTGVCQQVSRQDNAVSDIGMNIDYDFGWSALSILANMDQQKYPLGHDQSNPFLGTLPGQNNYTNIFYKSVEARLASEADDDIKWLVGTYWDQTSYHAHSWNRASGVTTALPLGTDRLTHQHGGDYSTFGQITIPIAESFRVLGGLRYSMDHGAQQLYGFNVAKRIPSTTISNAKYTSHSLTYKAGFEVDVAADSMVYANVSTGFRPQTYGTDQYCIGKTSLHSYLPADGSGVVIDRPTGGCAAAAGAGAAAVGGTVGEGSTLTSVSTVAPADKIKSYEVGSKNRFLDNKLQLNIDAYYYSFSFLGTSQQGINHANNVAPTVTASTGTKAYGSELESTLLLTSNDKITFSLAYSHTETGTTSFDTPACYNFGSATHPIIAMGDAVAGYQTANIAACNAKNLAANPATVNWTRWRGAVKPTDQLFNAPTWNGNVGYQHTFDLESGAAITAGVNVHFESSKTTVATGFYDSVNPAYHTTDFSLVYNTADGKWQLGAWVKNIENHPIELGAQGNPATDYIYPLFAPPRMWGVNLTANF